MPHKNTASTIAAALCGAALSLNANAATLTSAYEFNGDFHDAVLEGHDDDLVSGTRGLGAGTLGTSSFTFGPNQGVSLTNSVADIDNYSVELYFAFGPDNKDAAFRSILDPGAARSDLNLYARGNEALQFFPGPIGAANALVEGGFNHLVYTRATSGSIQVYANGVLALTDNTNAVESQVTGNVIHFFEDDGTEAASGEVDYIRLYNGVLSSANAEQLYAARNEPLSAVPVPASLPLIVPALGALALARRRARA